LFFLQMSGFPESGKMTSQIAAISSEEAFYYTVENSAKPKDTIILQINTLQPIEEYIQDVINYIKS
jgi:hypothetical protein